MFVYLVRVCLLYPFYTFIHYLPSPQFTPFLLFFSFSSLLFPFFFYPSLPFPPSPLPIIHSFLPSLSPPLLLFSSLFITHLSLHSSLSPPLLLLGHHSPSLVNSFSHVFAPLFPPLRNNKHPSLFTFFTRLRPSIFHFFTPPLIKYITSIFLLPSSFFFTRVLIVPFFFSSSGQLVSALIACHSNSHTFNDFVAVSEQTNTGSVAPPSILSCTYW